MALFMDRVRGLVRSDTLWYWVAALNVAYASGSLMAGSARMAMQIAFALNDTVRSRSLLTLETNDAC
ncbi:MAG: hypothetical protein C0510_00260 [Erythrobacter sp.]|nr:hypothetical protein [Erythrobacter sp.]MBA4163057.1 hypothetical protein [Erythrobacter sp.]